MYENDEIEVTVVWAGPMSSISPLADVPRVLILAILVLPVILPSLPQRAPLSDRASLTTSPLPVWQDLSISMAPRSKLVPILVSWIVPVVVIQILLRIELPMRTDTTIVSHLSGLMSLRHQRRSLQPRKMEPLRQSRSIRPDLWSFWLPDETSLVSSIRIFSLSNEMISSLLVAGSPHNPKRSGKKSSIKKMQPLSLPRDKRSIVSSHLELSLLHQSIGIPTSLMRWSLRSYRLAIGSIQMWVKNTRTP
jgi:hypothetical protein